MKNNNITLLDPNQITVQQHDPDHDAQRVVIVGDGSQIAQAVRDGLKDLKIEIPIPSFPPFPAPPALPAHVSTDVEYVQIPVIVKEQVFTTIEKPVYITEVKIVEIEKPVIIKERELSFSRIEVPVIVKEYKDVSKLVYIFLGVQVLLTIIGLIAHR